MRRPAAILEAGFFAALINERPSVNVTVTPGSLLAWVDGRVASAVQQEPAVAYVALPEFAMLPEEWTEACTIPQNASTSSWCASYPDMVVLPTCSGSLSFDAALSCTAREHGVILSVNLCERASEGAFNTQVIYDADGWRRAKYRKAHPWERRCFARPARTDAVVFNSTALAGVTLGIFTCLDIAFKEPAATLLEQGVRLFAYSASYVPGSAKRAWSALHGSTLLSSDRHDAGVYQHGSLLADRSHNPGMVISFVPAPNREHHEKASTTSTQELEALLLNARIYDEQRWSPDGLTLLSPP